VHNRQQFALGGGGTAGRACRPGTWDEVFELVCEVQLGLNGPLAIPSRARRSPPCCWTLRSAPSEGNLAVNGSSPRLAGRCRGFDLREGNHR
jgi:hypothetical protein